MNDAAAIDTSATPASRPCPDCSYPRAGRDRYCERCGFDFLLVSEPASSPRARVWSVLVSPDSEHFARTAPAGLSFPASPAPPRSAVLDDSPVRIGRSHSRAEAQLDIDVEGDPAVSRLHASLVRQDDGTWAIADEGSSNGTTINEDARAIAPHVLVPLHDGDRVHLGAWTTITVSVAE